jgi:hypothetical protein
MQERKACIQGRGEWQKARRARQAKTLKEGVWHTSRAYTPAVDFILWKAALKNPNPQPWGRKYNCRGHPLRIRPKPPHRSPPPPPPHRPSPGQ